MRHNLPETHCHAKENVTDPTDRYVVAEKASGSL